MSISHKLVNICPEGQRRGDYALGDFLGPKMSNLLAFHGIRISYCFPTEGLTPHLPRAWAGRGRPWVTRTVWLLLAILTRETCPRKGSEPSLPVLR